MGNIINKLKSWFKEYWMLLFLSISCFIIAYLFSDILAEFRWIFYYLSLMTLSLAIDLPSNRFTKILYTIIILPLIICKILEPIVLLFICLIFHFSAYLAILSPLLFLKKAGVINLSSDAILYISLTLGSIIILLFGKHIIPFVARSLKDEHRPYMIKLKSDFIELLLNKDTFKVALYSLYFIILVLSSISTFTHLNIDFLRKFQASILQSFATFIAFERIVNNTEVLSKIKKDFKKKIVLVWAGSSLPITPTYYINIKKNGKSEGISFVSKKDHSDFFTSWQDSLTTSYALWRFHDFEKNMDIQGKMQLKRLVEELKLFEELDSKPFSKELLEYAQMALDRDATLYCFSIN